MSTMTISFSPDGLVRDLRRAAAAVLLFAGIVSVAHCGTGCLPIRDPQDVERNYVADITGCSQTAKDKAEARFCRQVVNRRYGLCSEPWPAVTPCDE